MFVNIESTRILMQTICAEHFVIRQLYLFLGDEAIAISDFIPRSDDELALKIGDVIRDITYCGNGLMSGELRGKRGQFPEDCMQVNMI
jgi:hypothetical protein